MEQTAATTRQDEEAIRVLKAQWALEADPSRIASLAAKFTGLQPMRPVQLVTMASLATELPAPGGVAPYNNPEDEVPGLPGSNAVPSPMGVPIEVKGRVAALQSSSSDLVKAVSVQQVAANFPPPPPVRPRRYVRHQDLHLAIKSQSHSVQSPVAVYETSARAVPGLPLPRPGRPLPLGAQVVRIRATSQPGPEMSATSSLGGGSLLGMAQAGSQN